MLDPLCAHTPPRRRGAPGPAPIPGLPQRTLAPASAGAPGAALVTEGGPQWGLRAHHHGPHPAGFPASAPSVARLLATGPRHAANAPLPRSAAAVGLGSRLRGGSAHGAVRSGHTRPSGHCGRCSGSSGGLAGRLEAVTSKRDAQSCLEGKTPLGQSVSRRGKNGEASTRVPGKAGGIRAEAPRVMPCRSVTGVDVKRSQRPERHFCVWRDPRAPSSPQAAGLCEKVSFPRGGVQLGRASARVGLLVGNPEGCSGYGCPEDCGTHCRALQSVPFHPAVPSHTPVSRSGPSLRAGRTRRSAGHPLPLPVPGLSDPSVGPADPPPQHVEGSVRNPLPRRGAAAFQHWKVSGNLDLSWKFRLVFK